MRLPLVVATILAATLSLPSPGLAQTDGVTNRIDIDQSGLVDFADFLEFARAFGSQDETFDLDADGEVGFSDFIAFAERFNRKTQFEGSLRFASPILGTIVRDALDAPPAILKAEHVQEIDSLAITAFRLGNGVIDLEGIQALSGLRSLTISKYLLTSTRPLGSLPRLETLNLSNSRFLGVPPNLDSLTRLKHLKLGEVRDLSFASALTSLESLEVDARNLTDFSPLADLSALRRLKLRGTKTTSLEAIRFLGDRLTHLTVEHAQSPLYDINTIQDFTELEVLELRTLGLIDISPLRRSTAPLKKIRFDNICCRSRSRFNSNQVSYIEPLANFPFMEHIDLTDNQVHDLSPLSDLSHLRHLRITQNVVHDFTAISRLSTLDTLAIRGNPLSSISFLAAFANVSNLSLFAGGYPERHTFTDLMPLTQLGGLEVLNLSAPEVSDFSPLGNLSNLRILHLWDDQLPDLRPLANLTNLKTLITSGAQGASFATLSSLTLLEHLSVVTTETSYAWLGPLRNLKTLWLRAPEGETRPLDIAHIGGMRSLGELLLTRMTFPSFAPLTDLKALTRLDVRGSGVGNIEVLSNLTSLRQFHLQESQVADLGSLADHPSLESLVIIGGNVDSLPVFTAPRLRYLSLDLNQVENVSPLVDAKAFSPGDEISLGGNPIDDISKSDHLPAIRANGVVINASERSFWEPFVNR